jgi:hypothetical protein
MSGVSGKGAVRNPSFIAVLPAVVSVVVTVARVSPAEWRYPRSTATQRPSRALAAIASLTSISSWPSAKVG